MITGEDFAVKYGIVVGGFESGNRSSNLHRCPRIHCPLLEHVGVGQGDKDHPGRAGDLTGVNVHAAAAAQAAVVIVIVIAAGGTD